jgi:AraC-like DNA-binding protein
MNRARATVAASVVRSILDAAAHYGIDVDALCRDLGIDRKVVDDFDGRVPYEALLGAWEALSRASGDEWLGLHFAERFASSRTFYVVGMAARRCATVGQAIELAVRYARVVNEATEMRVFRVPGMTILQDGPAPPRPPWPRHYSEASLAAFISLGRRWVGPVVSPLRVRFAHASPPDPTPLERWFGCPVAFEQPQNQLEFSDAVVATRLPEPDPDVREYLESRARTVLATLETPSTLPRLRDAVRLELADGARLEHVAKRLAMSKRTLQRRLADEGLDFQRLVDEERCELALAALQRRGLSVTEAARAAGYADEKAFRRACRRWTGMTPRELRALSARS